MKKLIRDNYFGIMSIIVVISMIATKMVYNDKQNRMGSRNVVTVQAGPSTGAVSSGLNVSSNLVEPWPTNTVLTINLPDPVTNGVVITNLLGIDPASVVWFTNNSFVDIPSDPLSVRYQDKEVIFWNAQGEITIYLDQLSATNKYFPFLKLTLQNGTNYCSFNLAQLLHLANNVK